MSSKVNYRTYDQLLSEVIYEFRNFYLEDLINPQEFIKIAKRCNYELGFKIFKTKDDVLEIEKGKTKLPNDFNALNFAYIISEYTVNEVIPQGTHLESVPVSQIYNPGPNEINLCVTPVVSTPPTICGKCLVQKPKCTCATACVTQVNCKGEETVLIQKLKYETRTYKNFYPIRIKDDGNVVSMNCPNKKVQTANSAYIKNGFIYTSFQTGKLYINYQGMLEDEEGNLLVPDHDLLNEFYEYAVKQRLLENLIMNGETVSQAQIQLIEQRYRVARNNAMSLVNTPDFRELRAIWETNRKAQYHNYYNMFKSH